MNEMMNDGGGWKYEACNINTGLEMASMGYDRPAMEQKTLLALDLPFNNVTYTPLEYTKRVVTVIIRSRKQ